MRILWDTFPDERSGGKAVEGPLESLSDVELVRQCQEGLPYQTAAFEILMKRYRQRVFAKVLSMIRHREEAIDLLQDIFIKVFNGLPRFQGKSSFSTWLYSITVNTCLNHIEKLQRRPLWWLAGNIDAEKLAQQADEELFFMVDGGLEREELRKWIETALNSLSDSAREVIQLRYFEEKDYRTIADELGIGLSAAKMRLKRAREEFKEKFEKLTAVLDKGDRYATEKVGQR